MKRYLSTIDAEVDELTISHVIRIPCAPVTLYAGDCVPVEVSYDFDGSYIPAKLWGAPEDCYPAEYPDLYVENIQLAEPTQFFAGEDCETVVLTLPAGTDISADLSNQQLDRIEDVIWEEASCAEEY